MTQPSAAGAIYRGMDRAALDAAYNNAAAVADSQDFIARWREESAAARSGPLARLDIPYGGRPRERFDYFAAGRARPPLFVFIHGGYWQRNDKDTFAFVAEGPRAHGIDVATIGYTLAPDVRLTADRPGRARRRSRVRSRPHVRRRLVCRRASHGHGREPPSVSRRAAHQRHL
jgi:arylformamidase